MSASLDTETRIAPSTAFKIIRRIWHDGISIVPLFGAGISIEAGIPGASGIVPYLAKVLSFLELELASDPNDPQKKQRSDRYSQYVSTFGWPDPHQLNSDLLDGIERCLHEEDALKDIVSDELLAELREFHQTNGNGTGRRPTDARILADVVTSRKLVEFSSAQGELSDAIRRHGLQSSLRADWRTLLRRVTEGNRALTDSFFDRLIRFRRPATSHQFVAFLKQLLGWRLILTTNFDSLIEQALRAEGMEPAVFELPENGPVPDPELVRDKFSLVKLHGGRFDLRIGETLDTPMDTDNIDRFKRYLPDGCVLLVIGYGGSDRRVMSLIDALATDRVHEREKMQPLEDRSRRNPERKVLENIPRVIWVHRGSIPRQLEEIAQRELDESNRLRDTVVTVDYHDGGLFLKELYNRLTTSQPATPSVYQTLGPLPPHKRLTTSEEDASARTGKEQDRKLADTSGHSAQKQDRKIAEASLVVFYGDRRGVGTSRELARHARRFENSHSLIWCDLEEVPSVDVLVKVLLQRFQRLDEGLAAVALPGHETFYIGDERRAPNAHELNATSLKSGYADPRVVRIVRAMRRGRYLVALDSMAEFGRSHIAHDVAQGTYASQDQSQEHLRREVKRLYEFLTHLAMSADNFGESKLSIAHNPVTFPEFRQVGPAESSDQAPDDIRSELGSESVLFCERMKKLDDKFDSIHVEAVSEPTTPPKVFYVLDHNRDAVNAVLRKRIEAESDPRLVNMRSTYDYTRAIKVVWPHLKRHHQKLLFVAAAFRRPRGIIALRRLEATLPRYETPCDCGTDSCNCLEKLVSDISRDGYRKRDAIGGDSSVEQESRHPEYTDVDRLLAELSRAGLLVRQEGAFYWMHSAVRNYIYHKYLRTHPRAVAGLHHLIANYYHDDLYQPSNDLPAFFEYAFHRVASWRIDVADEQDLIDLNDRLLAFTSAFAQDSPHLLAETHARSLVSWLGSVRSELKRVDQRIRLGVAAFDEQLREEHHNQMLSDEDRDGRANNFNRLVKRVEGLTSRLCGYMDDLEADVLLEATDFCGCARIRLQQVRRHLHFVQEAAQGLADDRDHDRQSLLDGADRLGTLIGWLEPDDPPYEGQNGPDKSFAEIVPQIVDVMAPAKPTEQDQAEDNQNEPGWIELVVGQIDPSGSNIEDVQLMELVNRVVAFGICLKGARLCDRVQQLLEPLRIALKKKRQESDPGEHQRVRNWALLRQLQCSFRLLDNLVSERFPQYNDAARPTSNEFKLASKWYKDGLDVLIRYPGSAAQEQYGRFSCYLRCLKAKSLYLQDEYLHAETYLDSARGSAYMASGRSGRLGYAVCQLRQAESLILYSDHLLKDDKQNSIPRNRAAKVKLDRAEEALQQSRDILVCERRNVWWWTLMYLIESQLRHDQVALSLLPLVVLEKNAITEPEQELRRSKSRKQRNWTIRKGLRALSAGLDNNGRDSKIEDRVRREQFLQLWWRFCICHCASYVEHHETGDEELWHDEWKKINLETDLSWLWKSQTTTHRDKYQEIFPDMHKQIHDLADESKMLDRKQLLDFETHFLNNIEPKVTSKTEEGQVT